MTIPRQMQAYFADDQQLTLRETQTPQPKTGEVLIRVAYAGLNRADLFQVQGTYPPPEGTPNIPGLEVSGSIVAHADDVTEWQIGDDVCALLNGGGYAEYVCVPAVHCLPIPANLTLEQAAALPECAATVWMALFSDAALQTGERVLIHGGGSGIGTTGIQMLRAYGCDVFTTVGSDAKAAMCESLGAHVIRYKEQDFAEAIKSKGGVDVVLDMVGGDYIERSLQSLCVGGRLVSLAFLGGSRVEVSAGRLLMKRLRWIGTTLRARTKSEKAGYIDALRENAWPWVESGQLIPVIDSVFPLNKADSAHEKMQKYLHCGKILLHIGDNQPNEHRG